MKKNFFSFTLFIGIFLSGSLSAFEISGTTCIILPEKPLASTILAGEELEKYIQKSTAISLIRDRKKAKNFIYIGLASDFREIPRHLKDKLAATKAEDSYICHIEGSKLFLAGKSKTAELYAVYQFLERELGIRFLKPANKMDSGEYIPVNPRKTLVIPEQSFVKEPAFRRRLLVPTAWNWIDHPVNGVIWSVKGGFQMRAAYNHDSRIKRKNLAQKKLYEPRTAEIWEDNYHNLLQTAIPGKKYFAAHPEYFALVNGKRINPHTSTTAYCLSNPEVRRLTADYIIRNIRKKKAAGLTLLQGGGMADMSRGWCECAECLKENESKSYSWQNISNVYNRTFKAIFDMVYREIPDANLMIWAYHTYRTPPSIPIKHDARVHFLYLTHGRCYAHSFDAPCHRNTKLLAWMRQYIPNFKRISIYEYFLCSGGLNYVPQELTQAHDLKFFHKEGVTGWEEETFFEDSTYWRKEDKNPARRERLPSLWQWLYLTGKLLWDPELDARKVLADAESKYYTKAYPAMKKYHDLRRLLWKEGKNCFGYPLGNERLPLLLNNPADKEKLLSYLNEAEKLAGKDEVLLYRISLDRKFLQTYWIKANEEFRKLQGKVIQAPSFSGKIQLDGKGDEKAWKNAFYVTDFRETFTKVHAPIPAANAVSIGVLSDKENLYFLVRGKEPLAKYLLKGKNIWEKSSIELFIHPQSISNEYYHLLFPLDGTGIYEARCPGNLPYKIGAEYKVLLSPGSFTMEIKVPAWKFGDFKSSTSWKCNMAYNRFIYKGKLIKGHYSLNGNLYHNVTKFLPLRTGSFGEIIPVNGLFNKTMKNKRKYPSSLQVLEKVPSGPWYANLPAKEGAFFGIRQDSSPYDETLSIARVMACCTLPWKLQKGEKLTISFEAKGKGKLAFGIIQYQKTPFRFRKTFYPAKKDLILTDKWQKCFVSYTMGENELIHLAFNALRGEAQIDNVTITKSR